MTKLPKKFQICTKYDRTSRYQMTLGKDTGKYYLQNVTSLEDAYNEPIKYSAKFVQEAIDCGNWIITKDMDEPELVFPFTFECPEGEDRIAYTATKGQPGIINVEWETNSFGTVHYSEAQVKEYIKDGIWIVKNVGKKAKEPPLTVHDAITIGNGSIHSSHISVAAPQAPQSTPLTLTIECNTDAAVAAVERLASALEAVNIAMESYIKLKKEMGNV